VKSKLAPGVLTLSRTTARPSDSLLRSQGNHTRKIMRV
jgi:hypothetical protein